MNGTAGGVFFSQDERGRFLKNISGGGGGGGPNNKGRCFALQLEHQTKDETTRGQIRLALVQSFGCLVLTLSLFVNCI